VWIFELIGLPAGRYTLRVQSVAPRGGQVASRVVEVAGAPVEGVELAWNEGTAALDVVVRGSRGVVEAAMVHVVRASVSARTYSELEVKLESIPDQRFALTWHSSDDAQRRARDLGGDLYQRFSDLIVGNYSVCVVPLTRTLADTRVFQWIAEQSRHIDVVCAPVAVTGARDQVVVVEAAPMKRLP
jgi:hypothetical protein